MVSYYYVVVDRREFLLASLAATPDSPVEVPVRVVIDRDAKWREHFSAESTTEGHSRLYEHYCKQAPHQPDTEAEMVPLFHAVYHGCRAGKHAEARRDVYRDRIRRGDEAYLNTKLGVFGIDLSLLANFFARPWTEPHPSFSAADQSWVISTAAFALRALGRLADAVEPRAQARKLTFA